MPKAKLKDILGPNTSRSDAFSKVKHTLTQMGFSVTEVNDKRPWGGYLVIEPAHTPLFLETFFADKELPSWLKDKYLSPKVMLWAPGEILSWQYQKLKEIIEYAYHYVPGYHSLYQEAGVKPEDIRLFEDIKLLPFTTKELIRDNLKDFTTRDSKQKISSKALTYSCTVV